MIEAVKAASRSGGLYRGTEAVLAREVPFYVLGMVGFEQLKKAAQGGKRFALAMVCELAVSAE